MSDISIKNFKNATYSYYGNNGEENAKNFVLKTLVETYGGSWGEYRELSDVNKDAWLRGAGVYEIKQKIYNTNNPISQEDLQELYVYIISGNWGLEYYDILNDREKYAYIYSNSGGDLISGGPQRWETIQGLGDGAKLFDVSFKEDDSLISNSDINENNINVWDMAYDYIQLYDEVIPSYAMPSDIDHVKYSIGCLSGGTSEFNGSFIDCNTSFGGGIVTPGNRENLSISYESGVNIIKHVDLNNVYNNDYDVLYDVSNISISANPSSTTEVFASLVGSSLSFNLAGDDLWGGKTYTDAYCENKHAGGYYPSWVDMSVYDDDGINYELCAYVCVPGDDVGGYKINFDSECRLKAIGVYEFGVTGGFPIRLDNGIGVYEQANNKIRINSGESIIVESSGVTLYLVSADGQARLPIASGENTLTYTENGDGRSVIIATSSRNKNFAYKIYIGTASEDDVTYEYNQNNYVCIYKVDGESKEPLDDKSLSGVTFMLSDDTSYNQLPGDSFIMIPTKKIYNTLSNNTQLKQGVIYRRGYAYYTGSLLCSISQSKNHVGILINTPLRGYGMYHSDMFAVNYDTNRLFINNTYHTVGTIDETSITCDNDNVTVTYDKIHMKFNVVRNESSVTQASVYFSIENGLRYKMLISFE